MVKATIIYASKFYVKHKYFDTEAVVELKIWSLPPSESYPEGIKYSLFCVNRDLDEVVVGFDNHHPKGHHIHLNKAEEAYAFEGIEQLVSDFFAEIIKQGYDL